MPTGFDPLHHAPTRQVGIVEADEDQRHEVALRLTLLQKAELGSMGIGEDSLHAERNTSSREITAPRVCQTGSLVADGLRGFR